MLNIKPVMHVDDEGRLIPLEKVRGRKKSLHALVDHMEKTAIAPIDQQMVFITHGDCLEDAEYVAEQVKKRFGVKEVVINYVDPVIGAHSGPGTTGAGSSWPTSDSLASIVVFSTCWRSGQTCRAPSSTSSRLAFSKGFAAAYRLRPASL